MSNLKELGYDVVEAPAPSEAKSYPDEGTLGDFGYETLVSPDQVREELQQERDAHVRFNAGPILTPAQRIPSSVVAEERTRRVLRNRYGKNFNEEEAYSNLPLVFDMSYSDRFSEKKAKFKNAFPKGDIKQENIGGRKITLVRETPQDPYQVYDDTILADIAHPGTIGAVAGAAVAPYAGVGMLGAAGLTGLGTFAGESAMYGIESARGYQHTPLDEGMASAALTSGIASAIDVATMGTGRALRIARPSAMSETAKTGTKAERVAERYGFEEPMRGQLVNFPLIPQIFRQAGATSSAVGRKMDKQERKVLDQIRNMTETDYASVSDKRLHQMMELQRRDLESKFTGVPEGRTPEELGENVQVALNRYKDISRRARDRLYRKARNEGDTLAFDIGDAQRVADKYLKGASTKMKGGRSKGGAFAPSKETRIGPELSPRLERMLTQVRDANKVVRTFTDSSGTKQEAIEQLKQLRTGFYDMMVDGDGIERRIATEMWSTLRGSMENPVAGKKRARDLLMRANQANAVREANLEVATIHRALNNYKEEPGRILQYFRPRNQRTIQTIKRLSGKKWEEIRNDFLGTLTQEPSSGLTWLNTLNKDKGTLRQLMTEGEEKALRDYLQAAKGLDKSKLAQISESQLNRAHRVRELVAEGQERLAETVRLAGGRTSPFAEDARRGLMREALDKATTVSNDGEQIIHSQTLISEINKILKSDDYKPLFTSAFKREMQDFLTYLSKIKRPAQDPGTSLETAELASSGKRFFLDLPRAAAAWSVAGANVMTGALLSRPRLFKRMLENEGLIDERILRGLTQVTSRMSEQAEEAEDQAESAMYDIYRKKIGPEALIRQRQERLGEN